MQTHTSSKTLEADYALTLVIPFGLPTLNEYINAERGNRYAGAKMKKDAEKKIVLEIMRQNLSKIRFGNSPVFISYEWQRRNKRTDKDNIAFAQKFVQDALVKAGVIDDDRWDYVTGFEHEFKLGSCNSVTIRITPCPD